MFLWFENEKGKRFENEKGKSFLKIKRLTKKGQI